MKFFSTLAVFPALLVAVHGLPGGDTTRDIKESFTKRAAPSPDACSCSHNNDAGRFRDTLKPDQRLSELCSEGGGCFQAAAGRMCVSGDLNQCGCAVGFAQEQESFHGDWFLWSAITCGGLSITIT